MQILDSIGEDDRHGMLALEELVEMEHLLGGRESARRASHGRRSAEVAQIGGEPEPDRGLEAALEDEEPGQPAPGAWLGSRRRAEEQRGMALDRGRLGDRRIAAAREPADTLQIEVLILECMHELSQGRGAFAPPRLDVRGPSEWVVHTRPGVERQQRLPQRPRAAGEEPERAVDLLVVSLCCARVAAVEEVTRRCRNRRRGSATIQTGSFAVSPVALTARRSSACACLPSIAPAPGAATSAATGIASDGLIMDPF